MSSFSEVFCCSCLLCPQLETTFGDRFLPLASNMSSKTIDLYSATSILHALIRKNWQLHSEDKVIIMEMRAYFAL